MRRTIITSTNSATINLNTNFYFSKVKVTKFTFIPDNINARMICLNINHMNVNTINSNTGSNVSYFFAIPFVNNNNVVSYTNDLMDIFDVSYPNDINLNKLEMRVTNENGDLLTFNNSSLIFELLFY